MIQQTLQYKGRGWLDLRETGRKNRRNGYTACDGSSLLLESDLSAVSRTAHPAISRLGDWVGRAFPSPPSVVRCTCWPGCAAWDTMAHGKSAGKPSCCHSKRKHAQVATRHVDDASGVFEFRNRCMIMRLRVMSGRKNHVRCSIAIRERAGNCRRGRKSSRDSGHHFKSHSGLCQRRHFLRCTSENERITAFQPHNASACFGVRNHLCMNLFLRDALCSAALAHIDDFALCGLANSRIACGTRSS